MNFRMMRMVVLSFVMILGLWGLGNVRADEGPPQSPRTIIVALDGSGDFTSIQEAVDAAKKGDTVFLKAGQYPQDVTIHSKEKVKLVGAGRDQVTLLGREEVVGALPPLGGDDDPALLEDVVPVLGLHLGHHTLQFSRP